MGYFDPKQLDLSALFRDERMFKSPRAWTRAGFTVINPADNGKIMVAHHPSVKGLLFKKYTEDYNEQKQIANYEQRREGSKKLREYSREEGLTQIAIPRKWILELPRRFGRHAHILVVERFDLLDHSQTQTAYRSIDPVLLGQLCTMVYRFRGMDSISKNVLFRADGQIAFIDTEHWHRDFSKKYLYSLRDHLTKERRALAELYFEQLLDGDPVDANEFQYEEA